MSVELVHLGRSRSLTLPDDDRRRLLLREIKRVRAEKPSKRKLPALAAPDCRIEVATKGHTRAYELVGGTLVDIQSGKHWVFPLAAQVMVWLNEDTWP